MLDPDKLQRLLRTVETASAGVVTVLVLIFGILMAAVALIALVK